MKPALLGALAVACSLHTAGADFYYRTFNTTAGLQFNGVATTSSCDDNGPYAYQPLHSINDESDTTQPIHTITETTQAMTEDRIFTATAEELRNASRYHAVFRNRDASVVAPVAGCPVRLRLTPARPSRAGSVMRLEAEPVQNGFETGFSFQISDHALTCRQVKDRAFSLAQHKSCSTLGGDGLAFVLHNDKNTSGALGLPGAGCGYQGIANGLALELDTWYNPEPEVGDLAYDHVSIQASAPRKEGTFLTPFSASRVGIPKRANLGDGSIHRVKLQYYSFIRYDLLNYFTASAHALTYLTDDGETRRLGTLVVYVDDMEVPLLAVPLNLNSALALNENQAFMGFTAGTGRGWQKHDILEWYFCREPGCPELAGDASYLVYTAEPGDTAAAAARAGAPDVPMANNEPNSVPPPRSEVLPGGGRA